MDVFYSLPASELRMGVATDDGQDIISVEHTDDSVIVSVYTPRRDDADADERNFTAPETRIYRPDDVIRLAVFYDTGTDLSRHPKATERREVG